MWMKIQIIDTFCLTHNGIVRKPFHIEKTLQGFEALEVSVPEFSLRSIYQQLEDKHTELKKSVKAQITFDHDNLKSSVCVISDIEPTAQPLTLEFVKDIFQLSGRGLQNFKTNQRDFWQQAMGQAHCYDVIGLNQEGYVTETSRFNLFLFKDNIFYTPPLDSGCINGAFRRECLQQGGIQLSGQNRPLKERNFLPEELKNYEVFVGNSLRGLMKGYII